MYIMNHLVIIALAAAFAFSGCKSDYERLLDAGLSSGVRQDSIFLGITFGMSRKDFYSHCWEMNRDSIIRQGKDNTAVLYVIDKGMRDVVDMNFYPNFTAEGRIYEMPVTFEYRGWAPWNKELQSDSLLVEVIGLLEQWHGSKFLRLERAGRGIVHVAVDGNRRILVHPQNERFVRVLYTDMTVEPPKPAAAEAGEK